MSRNILLWIGVTVLLTAIATLGVKSCIDKGRPAVVSPTQPKIDSVEKNVAETKRILDSIKNREAIIKRENDSLHHVTEKQSDLIDLRTQQVITWKKQYELARKYKDTVTSFASCDSMAVQVDSLIAQVNEREVSTRQLQNSYDSLLSNTSLHIARLEFDNSFLKEKFDDVADNCKDLEKDNKRLQKKANKRLGAGIHVTETFVNGKLTTVAGVGLHYTLVRIL